MNDIQCFKIKKGTEYDKAVKQHFRLKSKWGKVYGRVSKLLGENITKIARSTSLLVIDPKELTKKDNEELFKVNGAIDTNSNKGQKVNAAYLKIINGLGLKNYKELGVINYMYGIGKSKGQLLRSFVTSCYDLYFKTDFNLEKQTNGLVVPISEAEYEEEYIKELGNQEGS